MQLKKYNLYDTIQNKEYQQVSQKEIMEITGYCRARVYQAAKNGGLIHKRWKVTEIPQERDDVYDNLFAAMFSMEWDMARKRLLGQQGGEAGADDKKMAGRLSKVDKGDSNIKTGN